MQDQQLTPDQVQLIRFVAEGVTVKEVAAGLNRKESDIAYQLYLIRQALGCVNTAQLVAKALREKIIE